MKINSARPPESKARASLNVEQDPSRGRAYIGFAFALA